MNLVEISEVLLATPDRLRAMIVGLDTAVLSHHPAPNEWCINEIIGHLIEMDQLAFADNIKVILEKDRPPFVGNDVNAIAAARQDCAKDTHALIDELAELRQKYAPWVAELPIEKLKSRALIHKRFDDITAWDFAVEWPFHDFDHLKQISNNIKDYMWPDFTPNFQRALSE